MQTEATVSQIAPLALAELVDLAAALAAEGVAPATRRAYARAWRQWSTWCELQGCDARPAAPGALCAYLAHLVNLGRAVATLQQQLAAIAVAHKAAGLQSPTDCPQVRAVMRGARRRLGVAPRRPREPAMLDDLRAMVGACPPTVAGDRDRAILLVGFAGAFRRSELVSLELRDFRTSAEGFTVTIRTSKTDQEGEGRVIGLPRAKRLELCPVAAAETWIKRAGIVDGALFRAVDRHDRVRGAGLGDRVVATVVQRAARLAGLDAHQLAGHSLRRGFCTEAARAGCTEAAIMRQTGHKSARTVRGYIREGSVFLDNAASRIL